MAGFIEPDRPYAGSDGRDAAARADLYRRQLETIAENATLALFVMDERQQCTYMNPAAEALTGYALADVQGRPLHDVIHHTRPDGRPYPLEECPIDQAFPQGMREQGEEVFVHRDGHFYPVCFTASPIRDGERTVGTIIEVRPISEEIRAREEREGLLHELELERRRLETVFRHTPAFMATFRGPEHVFELANPAFEAITGRKGTPGRTVRELFPEIEAQGFVALMDRALSTGEPYVGNEVRVELRRSPGGPLEERFVNFVYQPLPGPAGAPGGLLVHGVDVTALVAARREEARLVETLHRVGRSLTAELDPEVIVQEVTDAATEMTGAQFGAFFYNVIGERGEEYTLYTISGVPREAFSRFPMPRNTPVFAPTFHGTGVVRSADITRDPRYGQMPPHHGMPEGHLPVRSYLAVPVISRNGQVIGGLFFGHAEPGIFSEQDERLVLGIAGWAAVAMDNARLYEAEHRARAEAERANRTKGDFLATMSHELRTPLNAMIGYTQLLLAGVPEPIPAGAHQKVERIGISARHLLELIEEILAFSRLEAGEERADPGPVALSEILREVQALTEPLAAAKGLDFHLHAPPDPPIVRTDARKVRQILLNLLGNAVKFTDQGRVELEMELVGDEVVFRVSDTGQGIAPEHLERIFEPFWQVDGGITRTAGGTGLGLSVTRRLARLLGGEVEVSSRLDEGTTFTVRLPAAS